MSRLGLHARLLFAKVVIALVTLGRDRVLRPEVHGYLAYLHRQLERLAVRDRRFAAAGRHRRLAAEHEMDAPLDDPQPPRAAAMAMAVPEPLVMTDARGRVVDFEEPA